MNEIPDPLAEKRQTPKETFENFSGQYEAFINYNPFPVEC
jgi:hypothetical protein